MFIAKVTVTFKVTVTLRGFNSTYDCGIVHFIPMDLDIIFSQPIKTKGVLYGNH
jgi:hypothetical protein